jgi:hypothetical protein
VNFFVVRNARQFLNLQIKLLLRCINQIFHIVKVGLHFSEHWIRHIKINTASQHYVEVFSLITFPKQSLTLLDEAKSHLLDDLHKITIGNLAFHKDSNLLVEG